MLNYVTGNACSPNGINPKLIIHCCNNIGMWGAGFVIALSSHFGDETCPGSPEQQYRQWHEDGECQRAPDDPTTSLFTLGAVQFVQIPGYDDLWVANMIGQDNSLPPNYNRKNAHKLPPPIRYPAIESCLVQVAKFAKEHKADIHCPRFGAGLAGGEWLKIEELINKHLVSQGIDVTVYDLPTPVKIEVLD